MAADEFKVDSDDTVAGADELDTARVELRTLEDSKEETLTEDELEDGFGLGLSLPPPHATRQVAALNTHARNNIDIKSSLKLVKKLL